MTNEDTSETISGIFRPPISKDDLRSHIVTTLLAYARQLHFIFARNGRTHEKAQASLLGIADTSGINDPDVDAKELGLSYESVRTSGLAEEMELLYDFAYHGMYIDTEALNSESGPSWISRILFDLSNSSFIREWDEYSKCADAIKALLTVCETAHARITLEYIDRLDGDGFMDWHTPFGCIERRLTFRQMSLLSGISEASLRTMANPKRKNFLKTNSDGRNAYVEADDAREWLITKGRYVPLVTSNSRGANLDLLAEDIRSLDQLQMRIDHRLQFLLGQDDGDEVRKQLGAIDPDLVGESIADKIPYLAIENSQRFRDESFLKALARALRVPETELALKAKQLLAMAELSEIERRLQETKQRRSN